MWRLVPALVVALLGLLTQGGLASAAEVPYSPLAAVYAYDTQQAAAFSASPACQVHSQFHDTRHNRAAITETSTERAPRARVGFDTTYGEVGHWPQGASTLRATVGASGTPASLACEAPASIAIREPAWGADGEVLSQAWGIVAVDAANGGSRIAANQAAGNAARDRLLAAYPWALPEQSFTTTAGVRRLDILTQGLVGIESKVGRTSLTATTRSQIAKDSLLLRNGDVNGVEWVFSRSGVTGQIGPTGPLADALGKAGIRWSLAP